MKSFTDIYLCTKDPAKSLFFPGPTAPEPCQVPLLSSLVEACSGHSDVDFCVKSGEVSLRGHRIPSIDGEYIALRRLPDSIWDLSRCGFVSGVKKHILDPRLCDGGLVMVSGMPGNGKSTTCASIIGERLRRYGGMCVTIEDPPEMPLQGMHGNGFCLQRDVGISGCFPDAVKDTMRAYPTGSNTIMLIGEIRDPETASLALRASVDGRLVISTTHSGNIVQTVYRLLALSAETLGSKEARNLLANGLRAVIHQKLNKSSDGLKLSCSALFDTSDVAGIIKNPKVPIESLQNAIREQQQKISSNQVIAVRK